VKLGLLGRGSLYGSLLSIFLTIALVFERVFDSYIPLISFGAVSVFILLVTRRRRDSLVLISFAILLCLTYSPDTIYYNLRYVAVFAAFLFARRSYSVSPLFVFIINALSILVFFSLRNDFDLTRFAFTGAVSLCFVSIALRSRLLQVFCLVCAVLFSVLSFGSSAAQGVILATVFFILRRWFKLRVIATILIPLIALVILQDFHRFEASSVLQIETSFFQEIADSSYYKTEEFSLRGAENYLAFQTLGSSDIFALIFGQSKLIYIPGFLTGRSQDLALLPHNYFLMTAVLFGASGVLMLVMELVSCFTDKTIRMATMPLFPICIVYILLCILLKHGFFDIDTIFLFGYVNYLAKAANPTPSSLMQS